jgi:threonine dehydratase
MSAPHVHQRPTADDLRAAHDSIRDYLHRTPVLTSAWLNDHLGAEVFFKCENFQKTGAFKLRGAANAVFSLSETELARGVMTASSGNHGQALAYAASLRGAAATVLMPDNAAAIKVAAVKGYGARVVIADANPDKRLAAVDALRKDTGAVFIHPFDDARIIAGQGTAALELFEQAERLEMVLVPIGGGGLTSGTVIAAAAQQPAVRVIAVEPAGADDARRSLAAGRIIPQTNPHTVADGLRSSLGDLTFQILQDGLGDLVTVSETEIVDAMRAIWERMKIVIEPSSAVPVAALLAGKVHVAGKRIGVIISGGNVDLAQLPWSPAPT